MAVEGARDETADIQELWSSGVPATPTSFIKLNRDALFAYFARRVDSVEDAADLTGDVFVIIWRRADDIPFDQTRARMWLFGVARNVLSNHMRAQARRRRLRERAAEQVRHDVPLDESVSEGVHDALGALAPLDQEIVQLHHWDGFNLAEIAGILGRRPATIRSRYARARARLRQILSA
ncbi:sigma-70 family RNA polymerase sigma factor [Microbacterium barkeri]|uniref:RNA polymerase sigma factor n=1 Tax=Microbacterium barkeri TaxID=33917 RepID=UPI0024AED0B3|nr:sigma-70 family RNA polymerase sigma factor [Microbacterium barkeri]MDI6944272.1 sigma-70 family RNA polymerase sigma factor [Microbacterium barkeri]